VISRTSAFQYKGAKKDARTIGRELSVRYVLEGSVRKAGDELRITCQLIDAIGDTHLWAKKYSGTMTDIFDLQERVARSVAETLALRLTPAEDTSLAARPLPDVAAYQSYLRARQEVWTGTREALERALRHLEGAQEILGDNPLIHAGFAYVHFQKANFGYDQESAVEATERRARRALELDPDCGEALVVLGAAAQAFMGKLDESIDFLVRARRLRPGDPDATIWLTTAYHIVGRNQEALGLAAHMVAADPLNPMSYLMEAAALWGCGRMDDALGAARRSYRLGPDSPQTLMILAWTLAYAGRESELDGLVEGTTLDRTGPAGLVLLLHACLARRMAEARALLTEEFEATCRRDPEWSLFLGDCLAALGSHDRAMEWLENAVERGYVNHPFLAEHDPLLASLRGNDRFQRLLERAKAGWESFRVERTSA
jgi:tetratricopeptide (TPR) repeat protein